MVLFSKKYMHRFNFFFQINFYHWEALEENIKFLSFSNILFSQHYKQVLLRDRADVK